MPAELSDQIGVKKYAVRIVVEVYDPNEADPIIMYVHGDAEKIAKSQGKQLMYEDNGISEHVQIVTVLEVAKAFMESWQWKLMLDINDAGLYSELLLAKKIAEYVRFFMPFAKVDVIAVNETIITTRKISVIQE